MFFLIQNLIVKYSIIINEFRRTDAYIDIPDKSYRNSPCFPRSLRRCRYHVSVTRLTGFHLWRMGALESTDTCRSLVEVFILSVWDPSQCHVKTRLIWVKWLMKDLRMCVSISPERKGHSFLKKLSSGFFLNMNPSVLNPIFVSLVAHTGTAHHRNPKKSNKQQKIQ